MRQPPWRLPMNCIPENANWRIEGQGSKLAAKGVYMDVDDRRMQVRLTRQAKFAASFPFFSAIVAFAGFISSLCGRNQCRPPHK